MKLELIKDQMILTLKKDGFSVSESKNLIVATKNETILHIRSVEEIRRSLNYRHIVQKATTNKVGGIHTDELRKLIKESQNKKIKDSIGFICDKLNWNVVLTAYTTLDGKDIEYTEIATDTNQIFTMVFFNPENRSNFFALEMDHRAFLKMLENIVMGDLQTIAPSFYELIMQG